MLSLDDYFMVEVEKKETDPDTGKKVTRKVGRCLGEEKRVVLSILFGAEGNHFYCLFLFLGGGGGLLGNIYF